jgi:putative RecB family exonuclease
MAGELRVRLAAPPSAPRSLSPTSASTWQQCELKYALTYLYGWQEPSTLPQLVGNTAHRAVELLYAAPPDGRGRDTASELLRRAVEEEIGKETYAQMTAGDATVADTVVSAGEDALDGLFRLEDPATITVGPDGLEVTVAATLYGAPVRGRIDRVYDASGAQVIADYKTGRVPAPRFTQKSFFGLWTYAAALAASDPDRRLADRVELLYLIGRERLSRPVLRDVALEQAKTLARIWRQIGATLAEQAVTARPSRLCDWCSFSTACPARTRDPLPAVGSPEHDTLLRGAGLGQRPRGAVAVGRERVDEPGDEEGPA